MHIISRSRRLRRGRGRGRPSTTRDGRTRHPIGAAIDGARQKKQNEEACGAPRKWWPYTCLQLNDSYAVDPLLAPRWTGRRRWTLRPLKRRTYPDSQAGGERLHGKTASTRLVLGGARTTHHQTRLGRRPHDAPNGDRHAAEILRARLFPCPNRAPGPCRLRRRTSATPMRWRLCSD